MINNLMELLLFFMPGVLTELLFCMLKERQSAWWVRLSRILMFSFICLAMRCVFAVTGGYSGLEVSVVFHGLGNCLKYCILSTVEIVFAPPCLLILEKMISNERKTVPEKKGR